ncbi:MAG: alginate lyase family protein [Oleispira sp.]|nr:alginate lyase family protein [Oleispira sp.]
MKFKKYYHTIKNLKFTQILYRFKYILKRSLYEKKGATFYRKLEKRYKKRIISPYVNFNFILNDRTYYLYDLESVLKNEITFLNYEIVFPKTIDWHRDELNHGTRLWKLNLNYHEFLFDIALRFKESKDKKYLDYIERTVIEWFEQNPLGTKGYGKDNWNSYAISLRLIIWIKMYVLIGKEFSTTFQSLFLKLLWIQLTFLSENLEFDILGNHLIKNWKTLIWGKHFFKTTEFDKQIEKVEKYVYCQFSEKGMHEEYSPMYSGIVLEDLMEVFLFQPKNDELGNLIHKLFEIVRLLSNNNQYLFFNDSINNNGVQFNQLNDLYYNIFNIKEEHKSRFFDLDGFVGYKTEKEHLVFDFAKVVGGSQPGHVQCDALSFEYFLNGKKVFTNSGTFEYNSGTRREYSRSSESHNVLKYDAFDQSEIWGSYRMARKAEVGYKINQLAINRLDIKGTVKGYDFSRDIIHERRVIKEHYSIIIKDLLIANTKKHATLFFHLTPDFKFEGDGIFNRNTNQRIAIIRSSNDFKINTTEFYSEFGICEYKETMVIMNIKPMKEVVTKIIFDV